MKDVLGLQTQVVNRHFEPYDVYIGRGTKWGNPFKEGKDGTREEVIELYRQYAKNNPDIANCLDEIRGKRLGCSCKPQPCHGDVLVEMINMEKQYKTISIGIDQSYTRTGVSIAADGELLLVKSLAFRGCRIKSEKRKELAKVLHKIIQANQQKASQMVILCERIRTFSHSYNKGGNKSNKPEMFISTDYIKATGALIATIVDTAYEYGIPVFSVDTRSWKSKILGNSKGSKKEGNKLGAVRFVMGKGFDISSVNRKGNIVYDDDAADSACIALYAFIDKSKQTLKKEE